MTDLLDGRVVAKPEDRVALAAKLRAMSGRTHRFDCGFALVRDQEVLLASGCNRDLVHALRHPAGSGPGGDTRH